VAPAQLGQHLAQKSVEFAAFIHAGDERLIFRPDGRPVLPAERRVIILVPDGLPDELERLLAEGIGNRFVLLELVGGIPCLA
jgi:hypothetical protein